MKHAVLSLVLATWLTGCGGPHTDQPAAVQVGVLIDENETVPYATISEKTSLVFEQLTCGTISEHGLCGATFGMTREELESAFPLPLEVEYFDTEYPGCYYMRVAGEERGIGFMISNDAFRRLDIYQPTVATDLGVKVGMTFAETEALYPNSFRKPNFYSYPIENLIVDIDIEHRLLFVQDGSEMISSIRIGLTGAVNMVEGCL